MALQTASRKTVIVPLDTSDIINLNYLDVIPSRFHTEMNASIASVELDPPTEPTLSPKSKVELPSSLSVKNSTEFGYHTVKTLLKSRNEKSPKTVVTQGFDRRGRMNRITADCIEDSDTSVECYKQARLGKRLQKLKKGKGVNLAEILSSSSDETSESSASSVADTTKPASYEARPVMSDNTSENPNSRPEGLGVSETPSAAMLRLTEALKQLESTCSDDCSPEEDYRSPFSPLSLHPHRMNSIIGPSSSYWRSMMMMSSRSSSKPTLPKKISETLRSTLCDPKASQEYWPQSISCFSHATECPDELSPPVALSQQRTAAIWDWVSPKYPHEVSPARSTNKNPDFSTNLSDAQRRVPVETLKPEQIANRSLLRAAVGRSLSDVTRFGSYCRPLKAFEQIHNPPRLSFQGPLLEPPAPFAPTSPVKAAPAGKNTIQLTPPGTSTVWSFSPLYQESSSKLHCCEKSIASNCSLTPAVHSVASLGDVKSGDDIATCSTASTFTEVDCTVLQSGAKGSPRTPGDHRVLELLGQIGKPPEKDEVLDTKVAMETAPLTECLTTNETAKPVAPLVISKTKEWDESIIELSPIKPTRFVSPCSVIASDLHFCNLMSPFENKTGIQSQVQTDEVNANVAAPSESRVSVSLKECHKRNKRRKRLRQENTGEKCRELAEFSKKKDGILQDRLMQTAQGGTTPAHVTPSESLRLQRLKKTLPRTPGGSYSFRNREAEAAIAEYVKAELAASLQLNPKSQKATKPKAINVDAFLKKVTSSDVKCRRRCHSRHVAPPPSFKIPPRSTLLTKKPSPTKRPPFKPTDTSPRWHPIPPTIPNISSRINYLKYQQQSLAALIGKSRASRQALVAGAVQGNARVPLSYSYLSLYPKDLQRCQNSWQGSNSRLRGNRNNVTVVFGDSCV